MLISFRCYNCLYLSIPEGYHFQCGTSLRHLPDSLPWWGWRGDDALSGNRLSMFKALNIFFLFKYKAVDVTCKLFHCNLVYSEWACLFLKFISLFSFISELFWGKEWTGGSFFQLLFGYVRSLHIVFLFSDLLQKQHRYQSVSRLLLWKRSHATHSPCYLV